MSDGRYEPLPPVSRLPAWLWARAGRAARVLVVLAAFAAVATAVALAPRISDTKRDTAARERREAAVARARRIRDLRELQRPRSARTAATERALAVRDLERLITADARARPDAGRVLRTECHRLRDDPTRSRFSCTAVTSDLPGGEVSRAGSIGYPYRARVTLSRGRLTWCRIAGRPGEGSLAERSLAAIPARCGG